MIKKLLVLLVVAGLGYVGWLVWTEHLSPRDKAKIEKQLSRAGRKIKQGASQLARKTARAVHDKLEQEPEGKPAAAAGKAAGRQPAGNQAAAAD